MAWLDDHPPVRSQFRCPRRATPSGVAVVHTAESVLDSVGPDTGAENVARFIQHRDTPGSYHDLVDADSSVQLVRWECEAFHDATGSNPHSWGLSFACSYLDWSKMTRTQHDAFVERGAQRAAAWAKWMHSEHGIVVPARRITRAQSEQRVPGFISHAERDPARREDPGNAPGQFPWAQFLARFAALMGHEPDHPTPSEDDDVRPFLCQIVVGGKGRDVLLVSGQLDSVHWVRSPTARKGYATMIKAAGGDGDVCALDPADTNAAMAQVAAAVLDVPFHGPMPAAYAPLWKGAHFPASS